MEVFSRGKDCFCKATSHHLKHNNPSESVVIVLLPRLFILHIFKLFSERHSRCNQHPWRTKCLFTKLHDMFFGRILHMRATIGCHKAARCQGKTDDRPDGCPFGSVWSCVSSNNTLNKHEYFDSIIDHNNIGIFWSCGSSYKNAYYKLTFRYVPCWAGGQFHCLLSKPQMWRC